MLKNHADFGSDFFYVFEVMRQFHFLGILLDNILPGATRAERGLEVWEKEASEEAWEEAEAKWAAMKEGEARPV